LPGLSRQARGRYRNGNHGYDEHHRAFINRACAEPCSGLADCCTFLAIGRKSRRHLAGNITIRRAGFLNQNSLFNVPTRKLRRAVRPPDGDVATVPGDGTSKSAASRRFVALSAERTAAEILNDRVLLFFAEHSTALRRVPTDRGTQ
jgi:hypothetical protein